MNAIFFTIGALSLLFFLTPFVEAYAAPGVSVYAKGTYTNSSADIYLYADIIDCSLISFGVKLVYNPADLTVTTAEKNETSWYFGEDDNMHRYMSPDTSLEGEVVFVGGKLDINDPTAGVTGNGILLGHVSFQRNNSNPLAFSLTFGRNDTCKNFVTTVGIILDDQAEGVTFNPVISMVGGIHSADTNRVVFFGCYNNENGVLENRDCEGDWDFGGAGQIVGGNGNNITIYQYDTADNYTINLIKTDSVRSLDISAKTLEDPLPPIDFTTSFFTNTISLTISDPDSSDADIETLMVYWGDRKRSEYSGLLPVTFYHSYLGSVTDYHIRAKTINRNGEEFNYILTSTFFAQHPTVYDDFNRSDRLLNGDMSASGHKWSLSGTGIYNGRIKDGMFVSPYVENQNNTYASLGWREIEPLTTISGVVSWTPNQDGDTELSNVTIQLANSVLELKNMIHFLVGPNGWTLTKWVDGTPGLPIYSSDGVTSMYGRFNNKLLTDGTQYYVAMEIDRNANTITLILPDGNKVTSGPDPDLINGNLDPNAGIWQITDRADTLISRWHFVGLESRMALEEVE